MAQESQNRPTSSLGVHRLPRYGLLASLLCILASGVMWLWQSGLPLPAAQAAHSPANSLSVDAPADPIRVTKKIEDLRLGDWVLAKNPQLELEEAVRETDVKHPENLRALSLRLRKDDGTWLHLELLRTAEWAKANERLGKIFVYFEELGIEGWADLLSIAPCPQIAQRPHADCRLLTGRFIHESADAYDLTVVDDSGQEQTKIGVTGNHPVWSEDRQDFVRVDTLAIGEHLRDTQGKLLQVGSIEPRAGPEQVYNLEVDVEHVYFVSAAGLLVHNSASYGDDGGGPKKGIDGASSSSKPIEVTDDSIRAAMKDAPLSSQQARGISRPMVERYVRKLEAGELPPPIKVHGDIIVDGNHTYVAGRLFGSEPPIRPWIGGIPERKISWDDMPISPIDWDP